MKNKCSKVILIVSIIIVVTAIVIFVLGKEREGVLNTELLRLTKSMQVVLDDDPIDINNEALELWATDFYKKTLKAGGTVDYYKKLIGDEFLTLLSESPTVEAEIWVLPSNEYDKTVEESMWREIENEGDKIIYAAYLIYHKNLKIEFKVFAENLDSVYKGLIECFEELDRINTFHH